MNEGITAENHNSIAVVKNMSAMQICSSPGPEIDQD